MAQSAWQVLSNELAMIAGEAGRSVVAIHGRRHPSSGVVWTEEAIVTVNHGLRRDEDITVVLENGQRISAQVAGRDPRTDLAVLRLSEKIAAPTPCWGDASGLRIGEITLALGRSWRGNIVASFGIISGLIRGPWRTWAGGELDQFIRPDLTLYPGFSGGPLLNSAGEIAGINTAGLHRSGITIPTATVKRVAGELLERGRIERPYLGLAMQPVALQESLQTKLNLNSREALLVAHVVPGSPAEKAGVMLGDLLTGIEGKPVGDPDDVQQVLRERGIGQELELTLARGGSALKCKVGLAAHPGR